MQLKNEYFLFGYEPEKYFEKTDLDQSHGTTLLEKQSKFPL